MLHVERQLDGRDIQVLPVRLGQPTEMRFPFYFILSSSTPTDTAATPFPLFDPSPACTPDRPASSEIELLRIHSQPPISTLQNFEDGSSLLRHTLPSLSPSGRSFGVWFDPKANQAKSSRSISSQPTHSYPGVNFFSFPILEIDARLHELSSWYAGGNHNPARLVQPPAHAPSM